MVCEFGSISVLGHADAPCKHVHVRHTRPAVLLAWHSPLLPFAVFGFLRRSKLGVPLSFTLETSLVGSGERVFTPRDFRSIGREAIATLGQYLMS